MKQKYTITVSGVEMNVICEESPESIEAMVGMVDRKIKEISSGGGCSKTEAALLCALDYCADKIKTQRKVKSLESRLSVSEGTVEELEAENQELRDEIEKLKSKN